MLTTGKYQREHERYDVNLPLILESGSSRIIGRSQNLSVGGASISLVDFVESQDIEDQGSIIIRSQKGDIKTPYKITYRKEHVIGVHFSAASSTQLDSLTHIIDALPQASSNTLSTSDRINTKGNKNQNVTLSRRFWIAARMTAFLAVNLMWPLLKHIVKPKVVFAVYGTRGDQRAYFPDWFKRICPPVVVASYIKDKTSRGVMVSSVYTEEELATDSSKVQKYISNLKKEFPDVNRFALVGRLPGFTMKAGIKIERPLVDGSMGTRFAMHGSAMQIAQKLEEATPITVTEEPSSKEASTNGSPTHDAKSVENSIAILGGAGRIGSKLIDDLCNEFQTVIAIDPRYVEERQELMHGSTVIYTKRGERLKGTRLVLVLTARGDDIMPMVEYFEPGTVIADDTHPCIKRPTRELLQKQGVDLWKTVVTSDDYAMYPRMPNFRNDNIPGCLLEALVLNAKGDQALASPERFFEEAKACGYKTLLIRHPNDS